MKVWKSAVLILAIALLGTNGWWLHQSIDAGVTNKYQGQMMYERTGMLKQLISVTPELSTSKTKNEIITIVKKSTDLEPFDKEDVIWIGWIGLKFNDEDRLIKVIQTWGNLD